MNVVLGRKPTSPGEILREEFLIPLRLTQKQLADHLGCDVKVVNRPVNGRTSVTAEMALKLGAAFRTTPGFWLNAQTAMDLYEAAKRLKKLRDPFSGRVSGDPSSPATGRHTRRGRSVFTKHGGELAL